MVRRHGWQLPAHTFQVVAITVFFLLAVAFYVFLAPFLWFHVLEFTALALYSPLAFTVLLLYIRSSAIDPADPGVFSHQPQSKNAAKSSFSEASDGINHADRMRPFSSGLSTPSRTSSVVASENNLERKTPYFEQPPRVGWQKKKSQASLSLLCGLLCGWVVKDDSCRDDLKVQQPVVEEDILFCTLCNAEVRKFSKHCRSCDKCVDGFDHHCRWLNNCVGRKNYNTFVSLMATSLSLLILEWGIGMAVLVRCFVDKKGLEHQIVDKLGNGFSRAPFATVVAICTLVSILASIPLGELFFFHLILIRKGITTYEYVVAMRAQNEPPGFSVEDDAQSIPTSPSSSTATGLSGSSSLGLQYNRGAWCTPPRVFVEHQEEVNPQLNPGRLPSTIDPDATTAKGRNGNRQKKPTVRISAWKLVNLNADEATRAAAKARENSSVLRQLGPSGFGAEGEYTSSSTISSRSSMSADQFNSKRRLRDDSYLRVVKAELPPICTARVGSSIQYGPAELAARSKSSCSGPSRTLTDSTSMSPLPAEGRYGVSFPNAGLHVSAPATRSSKEALAPIVVGASFIRTDIPAHHSIVLSHSSADFSRAWSGPAVSSDGYEASGGESADDGALPWMNQIPCRGRVLPDHITVSVKEGKSSALLDRSLGSYGPQVTDRTDGIRGTCNTLSCALDSQHPWPEPSVSPSLSDDRAPSECAPGKFFSQTSVSTNDASPSLPSPSTALNNLIYSGTSIFFGGPIVEPPITTTECAPNLPLKPPSGSRPIIANPWAPPESRSRPRSALRSQSPVFAPRPMLSFTP